MASARSCSTTCGVRGAHAGEDVGDDARRVLAPRVVVGDDDVVGELGGDAAHERALAGVTVAAAAEYHAQRAAAVQARGLEGVRQRVRGVRIVDDRQRRAAAAAEHLHAPARRAAPAERAHRIAQRDLPGEQHREHGERVVDVELAHQAHRELCRAPAGLDLDDEAARLRAHARGAHEARPGRRRGLRGAQRRNQRRPGTGGERRAEGVIEVDHPQREVRPGEQARLGRAVVLHGAVVVEVITGEVGEHRGVEAHAVDARLVEGVGGHFHAHALGAQLAQPRQLALQRDRIGSGVQRGRHLRRAPVAERADVGGGAAAVRQRLRQQPRAGGLAVGAGDAGDGERLRRRTEEALGDRAHLLAQRRHRAEVHARGHRRRSGA